MDRVATSPCLPQTGKHAAPLPRIESSFGWTSSGQPTQKLINKPAGVTYSSSTSPTEDGMAQDNLINWIGQAVRTAVSVGATASEIAGIMYSVERCISEHRRNRTCSRVARILGPDIKFWTELPMAEAFRRMDAKYHISRRRHVPPSLHEIRQTLNLAQVLVSARQLRLMTFDGDETLWPNGANFSDEELGNNIISLLQHDVHVALVTAAGYGQDPEPYEDRLHVLLDQMKAARLLPHQTQQFWVFGGEANYLFRLGEGFRLHLIPYNQWLQHSPIVFTQDRDLADATVMLDIAENALREAVSDLELRARVIRKERAVGIVPGGLRGLKRAPGGSGAKSIRPEILNEIVARVREAIHENQCQLPFCAFNGGADVWVDVGNKAMALEILQSMLHVHPTECLHIGDQFTETGNDITVRQQSPCIWVIHPAETKAILRRICRELQRDFQPANDSDNEDTS